MAVFYGCGKGKVHHEVQPLAADAKDNPSLKDRFEQQGKSSKPRIEATMKTCKMCGELLPLSAFWRDRSRPDGHRSTCAECCKKQKNARGSR